MTWKSFVWVAMTLLALAIAIYAIEMLTMPEQRTPFVIALFTGLPIATVIHLMGGTIALATGALQFNARLRVRFVLTHRVLGTFYVLAVVVGGIAGFIMALQSTGGSAAQAGFAALAVCWVGSTGNAYRYIRRRNWVAHRNWMIRSYALTLAAVTLRLYIPISQALEIPIGAAYPAISWLCWVPNLLIAEWLVRSRFSSAMLPSKFVEKLA